MSIFLRRREFIAALGGAAAWPLTALAQQPRLPAVGFIYGGFAEPNADNKAAFGKGLSQSVRRRTKRGGRVPLAGWSMGSLAGGSG